MNRVILFGAFKDDVVIKQTNNGILYCRFNLDVKRVNQGREFYDLVRCVAWGELAQKVCQNVNRRGKKALIDGRLKSNRVVNDDPSSSTNNNNLTDNGQLNFITEVVVSSIQLEEDLLQQHNHNYNYQPNQNQTPNNYQHINYTQPANSSWNAYTPPVDNPPTPTPADEDDGFFETPFEKTDE